jgi:hypothetical protein
VDAEEAIPELLARLERIHQPCCPDPSEACSCQTCREPWPCDTARLVAHIRSLEAALKSMEPAIAYAIGKTWKPEDFAEYRRLAALGEAQ